MDDSIKPARKRLELTLETIWAINEAISRHLDNKPDEPLEKVHGSITVEIVKGEFYRIVPAPSILLQEKQRRRKTA